MHICFPASFESRKTLADQFFNFSEKRLARVLVAVWANNQGIKAREPPEGEPGNPRGDGWYYPRKGK